MKFYLHLFIMIFGGYILQSCISPSLNECYTNEKEESKQLYSLPEYDEDSLDIHFSAEDSSFKMVLPRYLRNVVSGKYTRKGRSLVLYPDIYIVNKEYHSDIPKGFINLDFTYKDTIYNHFFILDSVYFYMNGQIVRTDSNGTINYKLKKRNSKIINIKGVLGNGYDLYLNIDNSEFNFYEITTTKILIHFDSSFFKLRLRRDGLLINRTGYIWKPIQCNTQVINL